MKKLIAITLGDPAGVGPEIIAKAFRDAPGDMDGCFVVGDVETMRRAVRLIGSNQLPLAISAIVSASSAIRFPPKCIPVFQVGAVQSPVEFGKLSAIAARQAADCVVWAAHAALSADVMAVVTAPLNKEAMALAGQPHSNYPGHTEMLQDLAAAHWNKKVSDVPVRMMLANDELCVVLVSIHMSLSDAIAAVTVANVLETLVITHQSFLKILGRAPQIGVAGLNPHAGEGGLFGREEIDIIQPAIEAARLLGVLASNPIAPDTVFMRARKKKEAAGEFDVVVAMYHDQGLIPVKYLGVEKGVNVTLGLPIIRTSPDHGTAFDIAGTGQADPSSLIEAIRMARKLSQLAHHPVEIERHAQ
jgi:4-hydroxythreonine-4-phosphate dehydrogenase